MSAGRISSRTLFGAFQVVPFHQLIPPAYKKNNGFHYLCHSSRQLHATPAEPPTRGHHHPHAPTDRHKSVTRGQRVARARQVEPRTPLLPGVPTARVVAASGIPGGLLRFAQVLAQHLS